MKRWSNFKIIMHFIAVLSTIMAILLYKLFELYKVDLYEILFITFLTIAFHFDIRLLIGNIIPVFKSKININNKYFKLNSLEEKLYPKLKVKKWKNSVPTYDPKEFDLKKNSSNELIINMCNSEIVHTINAIVSYIPCLFILEYGEPIVFITTSFFASIYDYHFVIIQRYNRNRLIEFNNKKNKS